MVLVVNKYFLQNWANSRPELISLSMKKHKKIVKTELTEIVETFTDPRNVTFESLPMAYAVFMNDAAKRANVSIDEMLILTRYALVVKNRRNEILGQDPTKIIAVNMFVFLFISVYL